LFGFCLGFIGAAGLLAGLSFEDSNGSLVCFGLYGSISFG
jgi:hypothetical protein